MYRSMYCVLYDTREFVALGTNAKLAFHLLRLTRESHPSGIFPFYPALLQARNPEWTMRTVANALHELTRGGWIQQRDGLLWIRNALKYEPTYDLAQPEKRAGILNHLASLPRSTLIREFCTYYDLPVPDGTPVIDPEQEPLPVVTQGPEPGGATASGAGPGGARVGPGRGSAVAVTGSGSGSGSGNSKAGLAPGRAGVWDDFDQLWAVYPRKTNKAEARKAYRKLNPGAALLHRMINAVKVQTLWPQWQQVDDDGVHRWIPHLATWINGERWEDEAPPAGPTGASMTDAERRFRGKR